MSDILQAVFDAWLEIFLFVPRWIFHWALQFLQYALSALPEIDVQDPSTFLGGFSSDILYFLGMMEFGYGLSAVSTALLARFILRRIPFIGG